MKGKLFFWVPTSLFALFMGFSGVLYLSGAPQIVAGFAHLGYPDYFRTFLGFAKVVGVVLLVLPVGRELKQLAYAGFAFNLAAAIASHIAVGDAASAVLTPVLPAVLLVISFVAWRGRSQAPEHVASPSTLGFIS